MKAVAAHNVHDSSGKYQPGGTFGFAVDYLVVQVNDPGKDPTGIGWWCWMKLIGQPLEHEKKRTIQHILSVGLHLMPIAAPKEIPTGGSCHMKANLQTCFKNHMG